MNNLTRTNASLPFSVSFVFKEGSNYDFIVNIGDINSLIYQTYKYGTKTYDSQDLATLDLINSSNLLDIQTANGKYSFSAQGSNEPIKEFGRSWSKTFSTTESCSVFLVMPKIPPGYDFFSDTSLGKNIWWFISPNDFINAFHIETSSEEGFEARYLQNTRYTENKNIYQPNSLIFGLLSRSRPQQFTIKNDYFGKTYIKLAEIKIKDNSVSVIPFFRSNIVNPSRYLRLGTTSFRYTKVFVWMVGDTDNPASSFVHKMGEEMNNPEFFLKSLDFLRTKAKQFTENYYSRFYSSYDENTVYNLPDLTSENDESKFSNIEVYRVAILYKKYANGKFLFENVYEDISLLNSKRFMHEDHDEENLFEPNKPMTVQEALDFVGVREEDNLLELIGFAEDE